MPTDWLGIGLSTAIILFIVLIIWAKVQGDRIVDVLSQIRDFMRGNK